MAAVQENHLSNLCKILQISYCLDSEKQTNKQTHLKYLSLKGGNLWLKIALIIFIPGWAREQREQAARDSGCPHFLVFHPGFNVVWVSFLLYTISLSWGLGPCPTRDGLLARWVQCTAISFWPPFIEAGPPYNLEFTLFIVLPHPSYLFLLLSEYVSYFTFYKKGNPVCLFSSSLPFWFSD